MTATAQRLTAAFVLVMLITGFSGGKPTTAHSPSAPSQAMVRLHGVVVVQAMKMPSPPFEHTDVTCEQEFGNLDEDPVIVRDGAGVILQAAPVGPWLVHPHADWQCQREWSVEVPDLPVYDVAGKVVNRSDVTKPVIVGP